MTKFLAAAVLGFSVSACSDAVYSSTDNTQHASVDISAQKPWQTSYAEMEGTLSVVNDRATWFLLVTNLSGGCVYGKITLDRANRRDTSRDIARNCTKGATTPSEDKPSEPLADSYTRGGKLKLCKHVAWWPDDCKEVAYVRDPGSIRSPNWQR